MSSTRSKKQNLETIARVDNRPTIPTAGTDSVPATVSSVEVVALPGIGTPPAGVGGRVRNLWRLITHNPKVAVGLIIVAFFVLIAIFGPLLVQGNPNAFVGPVLSPPSAAFPLGTTQTGQNVLAQLLAGARETVFWSFLTGLLVTLISIAVGLIAGYFGGILDDILSLLINIFLVLPSFPLAILLATFFSSRSLLTVSFAIIVTGWAYNARVLRAQTLSMRNRDFVEAARANGEHTLHIIFAQILPNEIAIVAAGFLGTIIYVILATVGMEFIGLGNVAGSSWGTMLFWVQNNDAILQGAYWWFLPPTLCIALLGAGLSLINYGIDEIANPRLRETRTVVKRQQKRAKAQ